MEQDQKSVFDSIEVAERKRISFGVTVERHSKGTNYSLRIDGAESEEELMERAQKLWDKLEYRFGARAEG